MTWLYEKNCNKRFASYQPYIAAQATSKSKTAPCYLSGSRLAETFAFCEFSCSHARRMTFWVYFEITGVVYALRIRSDTRGGRGDIDFLGFGHIVPIVLLLLPVIAVLEACSGKFA